MSVDELAAALRDPGRPITLLDVREDDEREVARIEPSLHIPMGQVARRMHEIPAGRPLVVYCHMGGRSEMVAAFLEANGHPDVANLAGGIDAWSRKVDPKVPRY